MLACLDPIHDLNISDASDVSRTQVVIRADIRLFVHFTLRVICKYTATHAFSFN